MNRQLRNLVKFTPMKNRQKVKDMKQRILFYTPYGEWFLHSLYEITLGHALKVRDAEVKFIGCDKVFTDCDVHWENTNPKTDTTCDLCHDTQQQIFNKLGMSIDWLGQHISDSNRSEVEAWIGSLSDADLLEAEYNNVPLGKWVESSVHSHFRMRYLDFGVEKIASAYRSYLLGAALAWHGLKKIMDDFKPQVLFMLNGRFFSHRLAYELAQEQGIRVYCHERGRQDNSLRVFDNETGLTFDTLMNSWDEWKDQPLDQEELDATERVFLERSHGKNTGWKSFVLEDRGDWELLRTQIRLKSDQKLVTLFTSSDDEAGVSDAWKPVIIDQMDWVSKVMEYLRDKPEYKLVVRIHPNTAGVVGENRQFLDRISTLMDNAPDNVHFVMPADKVNSYQLIEMSDAVLVYFSSLGLEAPFAGKQTLIASKGLFYGKEFALNLDSAENLEKMLEKTLTTPLSSEQLTAAFRYGYHYLIRQSLPFPKVQVENIHFGSINYESDEDLQPGKDKHLDHLCDVLQKGVPVILPPAKKQDSAKEQERVETRKSALEVYHQKLDKKLSEIELPVESATDKVKLPITAILQAYNEGDIIYHVIRDFVEQGIQVYFIDHHSTDNTVEEASKWLGKGLIKIETFPEESGYDIPSDVFSLRYMLNRKEKLAAMLGPGWYIHTEADEFRESPWLDHNLRQGIERVDTEGFNAINFRLFDFKPNNNSFPEGSDVREHLTHYDPMIVAQNTIQIKAWKYSGEQDLNLWQSGGHDVRFTGRKLYPIPFILRHYSIRSQAHGEKKVFAERRARLVEEEREALWHLHYDNIDEKKQVYVHPKSKLIKYDRKQACKEILAYCHKTVTVIIPCYNYADYLTEAVESVVSQSFSDWEIIIVNDGSTDNSAAVASDSIKKYPQHQIRLIDQENSGQPAIARNNGIKASYGRYILALDADDYLHPQALEKLLAAVEPHGNNPTVAFGWLQSFGSDDSLWSASEFRTADLLRRNQLPAGSLYHRTVWELQGGYRENVPGFEDWDFWIGAARIGASFHNVPEVVQFYRKTENTSLIDTALVKHEWYIANIMQNNPGIYEPQEMEWAQDYLDRNPEIPSQSEVHDSHGKYPATTALLVNSHPERYTEAEQQWAREYQTQRPFQLTKKIPTWQQSRVLPITAIIAAYNEGDVISHVIQDFIEQNIQVYFIDHHSTDNTVAEASKWLGKGLLKIETFPEESGFDVEDNTYSWRFILQRKEQLAKQLGPGWYIHTDADEFRESPWPDLNLRQGIEKVDASGFDAINFKIYDFKPTDDNFVPGEDVRNHLKYYDTDIHSFNHVQIKAWKYEGQDFNLWESGGHDVKFEHRKIFPFPFILRHYAIRSQKHGEQKIFADRKPRFDAEERASAWHTQYDEIETKSHSFIRDKLELLLYDRKTACEEIMSAKTQSNTGANYYQYARPEVQEMINPDAKKILDVGCATGLMAAEIKHKLSVEVWGIELVSDVAAEAAKILDRVIAGKIEDAYSQLPDGYFDTIIFADVLEHLQDPLPVLTAMKAKLSPQGEIIASIPNVRHWSVLKGLIEGRWDYEDAGILDRTHLRFFTRKSVMELFPGAGFKVADMRATEIGGEGAPQNVVDALSATGLDISSLASESRHYQYLVKATPMGMVMQKDDTKELVSIVMLTYNALDFTKQCLDSVLAHTVHPYELILVDNASKDGTPEYLREFSSQYENVTLIENTTNAGFAGGNNQGVEAANGKYVLLLNNDVLVADGWLEDMMSAVQLDEGIGMVGPITNYISGLQRLAEVPYTDTQDFPGFAAQVRTINKNKITPRRRIAGFAVLMPKALYQEVDGLDVAFGIGNFEDDDLCVKVSRAGKAIMVHEGVYIHHFGHKTFIANKVDYSSNVETNGAKFSEKWPDVDYNELLEMKNPIHEVHPRQHTEALQKLESGDVEGAYAGMAQLVMENPLYEDALMGLIMAARITGRIEEAIGFTRRLIHLNPDNAIAYNLSGLLASDAGNYQAAQKLFRIAIEKDANLLDARRNYAEVLIIDDKFQEGVKAYLDIIADHPDDIITLLRMAELNIEAGRTSDAMKYAKLVLKVDPTQAQAVSILENMAPER